MFCNIYKESKKILKYPYISRERSVCSAYSRGGKKLFDVTISSILLYPLSRQIHDILLHIIFLFNHSVLVSVFYKGPSF